MSVANSQSGALAGMFEPDGGGGASTSRRVEKSRAIENDPLAQHLLAEWETGGTTPDGALIIRCPFDAEHSNPNAPLNSSTVFFPANTGGFKQGNFICSHSHCDGRRQHDFRAAVEYDSRANDFTDLDADEVIRDVEVHAAEKTTEAPPQWIAEMLQDPQFVEAWGGVREALDQLQASGLTDAQLSDLARGATEAADVTGITWTFNIQSRFGYISARDAYHAKVIPWMVKGLVKDTTKAATLYGAWGSFKSFLAVDLGCAVATGRPWHGDKPVKRPGSVVYVAAEGGAGVQERFRGWCLHNGVEPEDVGMYLFHRTPSFLRDADLNTFAAEVKRIVPPPVQMVIVDTWTRATSGADANTDKDMQPALDRITALSDVLSGAKVLTVSHTGKDPTKGIRGSYAQPASYELILLVMRDGDRVEVEVEKQKDGRDGDRFAFQMEPVALGLYDEDGEEVTTLVAMPIEVGRRPLRVEKKLRLGKNQTAVLDTVRPLLASRGGAGVAMVDLVTAVADAPGRPISGRNRHQRAQSAIESLATAGYLLVVDGTISLPAENGPALTAEGVPIGM